MPSNITPQCHVTPQRYATPQCYLTPQYHYSAAAPGVYFLANNWFHLFVPTFLLKFLPPFSFLFQHLTTFFPLRNIVKRFSL